MMNLNEFKTKFIEIIDGVSELNEEDFMQFIADMKSICVPENLIIGIMAYRGKKEKM